jgi:hypothetical protein
LAASIPDIDLFSESRVGEVKFVFPEIGNMNDSLTATYSSQRGL